MASSGPLLDKSRPQILYGSILRPPAAVLCLYSHFETDVHLDQVLAKLDVALDWQSYMYHQYAIHIMPDQASGLCYVCIANKEMLRRVPFGYLSELRDRFQARYTPEVILNAPESDIRTNFQGFAAEVQLLMAKFNRPGADQLAGMIDKCRDINDSLIESIDKLIERGEKIDVLVEQTARLSITATSFRREAQAVRAVMWYRNAKVLVCIGLSIVAVITLIVILAMQD